ncbi:hypothetical protein GCM10025883_12720 [Mobilicoccus caccae]|uniref:XPB/Ssl2-like helicase family protein n=1 Tax=Mobilicoccus caccae TaxID=1859295 RepID=A0ABQ6IPU0_9MICO|nr:hypothetical protein GCM10025883_12720 [Mobilicoccus caccae]
MQSLVPERACRHAEDVADLLRRLGPMNEREVAERTREEVRDQVPGWLADLTAARRLVEVRIAGQARWSVVEDAGRLRDALGTALPPGIPDAFLEPTTDPLGDLVSRYARAHGPFPVDDAAAWLGLGTAVVRDALRRLVSAGRVVEGELRPAATGTDYCDAEILRRLRRRSLATLRAQVEPATDVDLARFLAAWQGVTEDSGHPAPVLRGRAGLLRAIEQLSGVRVPASALEALVLPARVPGYTPAMLDEALGRGDVVWQGHGSIAGNDGWISLHLADTAPLTLAGPESTTPAASEAARTEGAQGADDSESAQGVGEANTAQDAGETAEVGRAPAALTTRITQVLATGGGYFFTALTDSLRGAAGTDDEPRDDAVVQALWELVWSGRLSNDTFAPVRALLAGGRGAHKTRRRPGPARLGRRGIGALGSRGLARTARSAPPHAAGRWTLLPDVEPDATARTLATAEVLLDRYGVLTRGSVAAEEVEEASRRCTGSSPPPRTPEPCAAGTSSSTSEPRSSPPPVRWTASAPSPARSARRRQPAAAHSSSPPPIRPIPTAPPSPGPIAATAATARVARPEPSSCCSTAGSCATSNGAGAPSSPSPGRQRAPTTGTIRISIDPTEMAGTTDTSDTSHTRTARRPAGRRPRRRWWPRSRAERSTSSPSPPSTASRR